MQELILTTITSFMIVLLSTPSFIMIAKKKIVYCLKIGQPVVETTYRKHMTTRK